MKTNHNLLKKVERQLRKSKSFLNYRLVRVIFMWVAKYWFPSITNSGTIIETWLNQIQKWERDSGPIWTIGHVKMLKLIYTRYISGEPLTVVPARIGLLSSGLPRGSGNPAIKYLNTLILEGGNINYQFVLTLLSVSRVMAGTKDPDLSTIEQPSTANADVVDSIASFIPTFLKYNKIGKLDLSWDKGAIRWSNKAGPQGRATLMSWRDASVLPYDLIQSIKCINEDLYNYIATLLERRSADKVVKAHKHLKGDFKQSRYTYEGVNHANGKTRTYIYAQEEALAQFYNEIPDTGTIRKLSVVNDPEAKARIIAILDFWSQEALHIIHKAEFKILKSIQMDRTFTQDPVISNIMPGNKYHSIDLTAATDRFPLSLQEKLMAHLTDDDKAKAWSHILVGNSFEVPWIQEMTPTGIRNKSVSYAAGQPMGAYSSWGTFALTHHLVVQYAAHCVGYDIRDKIFDEYILLGDDIVIYNDEVAHKYKELMDGLGVGLSPHKTHTSSTTYEFAKRWFHNNKEITGIQVKGFVSNIKRYHLLYASVKDLYMKGIHTRIPMEIPHLIVSLLKDLSYYSKERKNLLLKIEGLNAFMRYIHDNETTLIINHIKKVYKNDWFHLPTTADELTVFLNNYIVMANINVINKKTSAAATFSHTWIHEMAGRMSYALADGNDIWTSPSWLVLMSPITEALRNKLKLLKESLNKSGSIKEITSSIDLPDESLFHERSSVSILNTRAELASKFYAELSTHIKGRPPSYPGNLSELMAHQVYDQLNGYMLNEHKYRTWGLIA